MAQAAPAGLKPAKECAHCHEHKDPSHFFCPYCSHDLHNPDAKMLSPNNCRHALYTTRHFDFCPTCKQFMNYDEGQMI